MRLVNKKLPENLASITGNGIPAAKYPCERTAFKTG